jgi:hypothetical protein
MIDFPITDLLDDAECLACSNAIFIPRALSVPTVGAVIVGCSGTSTFQPIVAAPVMATTPL